MAHLKSLPDDMQGRIRTHVENSSPNPDRPRLPEDIERQLDEVERRTAACYAGMEELSFQVEQLVREIKNGPDGDE